MQMISQHSAIKTGDILLVHSESFIGKEIQHFQKYAYAEAGEYNHAGVFVWIEGKLMVSEAVINGVQLTNFKNYFDSKKYLILMLRPTFEVDHQKVMDTCLEYCGTTKYDFGNLLFLQMIKMLSRGKVWLGGSKIDNKFICGEWAAFCTNQYKKITDNPKAIAPANLYLHPDFSHHVICIEDEADLAR